MVNQAVPGIVCSATNSLVCLWGGVLVLIVVEGAALVFVAAIAVDEYVASECILVLYTVRSAATALRG